MLVRQAQFPYDGHVFMSRFRACRTSVVALAAALPFLALPADGGPALTTHSSSTIGLLAIDAAAQGNTATSVGSIDGCARVETGSEISVDYVVDSIPQDRPMIAFEAQIRYDSRLLEVLDVDRDLLLAAAGVYSPFAGLSDDLPDSDGDLRVSVLDTASSTEPEANVETGAGTLARITFRAKAAGISAVAIAVQQEPLIYPLIQDTQNEMIFVDRLGSAVLAIGQDCPAGATAPKIADLTPLNEEILAANPDLRAGATGTGATASPPATINPNETRAGGPTTDVRATPAPANAGEDDSSDTWLIAGILVLLMLGTAAGGGWYLYRRSRISRPG